MSIIVSISPEIALDFNKGYAGGLGVLEGDRFYAASRLGLRYLCITLYYPDGYVEYDEELKPVDEPQDELLSLLESAGRGRVEVRGDRVEVEYLRYRRRDAEVVFVRAVEPEWARKVTRKLYIESTDEERFYKYTILARAAVLYVDKFIGWDKVRYMDLQESYSALVTLIKSFPRYRLIIHTPAPWAHPHFPCKLVEEEFGKLPEFEGREKITLTELGLSRSKEAVVVSKAMLPITRTAFPSYADKIRAITNGVEVPRWAASELVKVRSLEEFKGVREKIRSSALKSLNVDLRRRPVFTWARRITPYKRPWFMVRLVEDFEGELTVILGGKAHIHDTWGYEYMKSFAELARERSNVYYIPNINVKVMKTLIAASDVWCFTPLPAWEASGTSFMKAGVNGVPSIASKSGATTEVIDDGFNGWLFGEERSSLVPLGSEEERRLSEREYGEFKGKVEKILDGFEGQEYWSVAYNAFTTFRVFSSMDRLAREYDYV